MRDFNNDKDGVKVIWEGEDGWLVYEYTGILKGVYPARLAWIGHRCMNNTQAKVGFVSAEMQDPYNICGWCNEKIPTEVQGVALLYNYGKEGE